MNSIITFFGRKVFKNFYLCLIGIVILTILTYKQLLSKDRNRISPKALSGLNRINNDHYKRDWHDYRSMHNDQFDNSPGAHGQPAELLTNSNPKRVEEMFKDHGYNAVLSDRISPKRSLPDIRPKECMVKKYLIDLPHVSVIIPLYNEHISVVIRTIDSVVHRSPSELLKEIIIVDDGSTVESLGEPFEILLKFSYKKLNLRVIRLKQRIGAMHARAVGAKEATGEVLVFLDAHTEATYNWLPPILEPILEDYRSCVCPVIDTIDPNTFAYRKSVVNGRGAFDWEFNYREIPLRPENIQQPSEPYVSPVIPGGIFAMSTKFFNEIGGYDEGLDLWGGEHFELSFKVWQCGGRILNVPCSRFGHVDKMKPYKNPSYLTQNLKRIAEVWMDEYKEFVYTRNQHRWDVNIEDISQQVKLRNKLRCKSFKWYMQNVASDVLKYYPLIEPQNYASGAIQSLANPDLCINTMQRHPPESVELYLCDANLDRPQRSHYWIFDWRKNVRSKDDLCLEVMSDNDDAPVVLNNCNRDNKNQIWKYDMEKKWLVLGQSDRCVECNLPKRTVFVNSCREDNDKMRWEFGLVNATRIMEWNFNED